MCIHSFNNNLEKQNFTYEEYDILSSIYKSIESNDRETAIDLTNKLISLQTRDEDITALKLAIESLI
ncbi:hypothetical protein CHL78_005380 [Romboutsia weinsteinii]|uniref:Uncharacterized protein n=1 Tax=Romboutsia weinsteinii TaxID=2020949 RepID=A0A371J6L9_9FIRM|nr:hypothetical protein [Romboutsia weinsteinii]RDY28333.1 hypothetical protein CHL78_005380 [Romboutsia weinsteinii]